MLRDLRPRNLNLRALLLHIRLPLPGWVSILHRASGVLLLTTILWVLELFERSRASIEGFEAVRAICDSVLGRTLIIVVLWAYCHHMLAGVRFLCIDLGMGATLGAARISSVVVLVVSVVITSVFALALW